MRGLAIALIALLAACSAEPRFQLVSTGEGVLRVDVETGQTWLLVGGRWAALEDGPPFSELARKASEAAKDARRKAKREQPELEKPRPGQPQIPPAEMELLRERLKQLSEERKPPPSKEAPR